MITHKSANTNYWHKYLRITTPNQLEAVVSEKFIKINNTNIHLDIFEIPKNGLCAGNVVFIHGTSVYSRFYADFCYLLNQKGFRVFLPDMPGHGLSGGKRGHFVMK